MIDKDYLEQEQVLLFSNPSYESALIGVSHDDRAIYDYDLMIKYLMETDGISEIDAIEFIDYNTIRALSYYDGAPIIMFKMEPEEEDNIEEFKQALRDKGLNIK